MDAERRWFRSGDPEGSENGVLAPACVEIIKGEQDGSRRGPTEKDGLSHAAVRTV